MSPLLETDTYGDDRLLLTLRDRQLRTLFEMTLDAIAITDDEGRYLDMNPAACELFGLERDELLGLSIADFAEPGFDFWAAWEEFQQQEKMRGEFRLVRANGELRVVEYAATANFLPHRHLSVMRDITEQQTALRERKRAEEQVYELTEQLGGRVSESLQELRKTPAQLDAKNLLEKTVRHVPGAVYQLRQRPDGTFHFPYASAGFKATCGVSPEEVQEDATKAFAFIHEEDRDRVMQAVMESAANLTPWYCEYRTCLLESGRVIWVLGHSTPQRKADGSTIWYGYIREITDQKQAEAQLRQQEEKYRAIVQQAAVGIKQANLSGRLLQVNPGFCQLLGYTKAELLALNLQDITHPDDRASSAEYKHQLYAGEIETLNLEKRFLHKDGSTVWTTTALSIFRDAAGQPISDLGIVQDISDRKLTEAALIESEAQNRAILQAIPDMMFRVSREGVYLSHTKSPELLDFQGREQSLGRNMAEFLPPEIYQRQMQHITMALETRQTQIYEHEVMIEGHIQQEEVRVVPIEGREEAMFMIRDISDRKQAEAKLMEVTQLQQAILDGANYSIIATNTEGMIKVFNPAAQNALGYSSAEVIDKISPAIFHDLAEIQQRAADLSIELGRPIPPGLEAFTAKAQLGIDDEYESTYIRKDGSRFPVELSITALRDESGTITGFLGIARDISDRKRTELALAESEAQNRALLQSIPDIIFRMNRAEVCLSYFNPNGFFDILDSEQPVGKSMGEYLPPEIYRRNRHNLAVALETRQTQIYEQEVTIAGRIQYEEVRVVPIEGREEAMFMIRDISDRKRQEQAFRLIVEGTAAKTGEGFFRSCVQYLAQVLDVRYAFIAEFADAEKTLATTRAFWAGDDFSNNFIYNIQGSPNEHILGEFCLYPDAVQSLFPEDIDLVTLEVESYAGLPILDDRENSLGLLVVMDTKPMVQDTETQSAILKIFATRAGAEIERLQAEEAVRRSEIQLRLKSTELETTLKKLQSTQTRLIQAEKMSGLGQLVAGIAHEINNPVSFIHGNIKPATDYARDLIQLIHLYQESYPSPPLIISDFTEDIDLEYLAGDFPNLLESMKIGATRIVDIVKSLRTFSRLDEAGLKAIDIHENINSTLAVLQNRLNGRAGNPEINIIKNYDDLPLVEAYGGLLNQVFMNLLANAIDAIEQQQDSLDPAHRLNYLRMITITTSTSAENQALISIRDNGCGMSSEIEDQIFNPFFTTKPVGKGTGMGLATSYQIIEEQHQGRITVNSTPGEGTEFILVLPIKQEIT